jgi:hypothetical protein
MKAAMVVTKVNVISIGVDAREVPPEADLEVIHEIESDVDQ